MQPSPSSAKAALRERIRQQTSVFLSNKGARIEKVPPGVSGEITGYGNPANNRKVKSYE